MTIQSAVELLCREAHALEFRSPRTLARYRHNIGLFQRHAGITHVHEVTEERLRTWLMEGREQRLWKRRTYVTYLQTLIVFGRFCAEKGWLEYNPALHIPQPKQSKAEKRKKLPKQLPRDEIEHVLRAVDQHAYQDEFTRVRAVAVLSVFVFAGLRRAEVLALEVEDVDMTGRVIRVWDGKGGKDRAIPMTNVLWLVLARYLQHREDRGKECKAFFTCINDDRAMSVSAMKSMLATTQAISGVRFSSHRLRHTFATLMVEGNTEIYGLAELMGHSNIRTTTVYLQAAPIHLQRQIAKHPLQGIDLSLASG